MREYGPKSRDEHYFAVFRPKILRFVTENKVTENSLGLERQKVGIQSCAEQSSHENPLEPDDYANPGRTFSLF